MARQLTGIGMYDICGVWPILHSLGGQDGQRAHYYMDVLYLVLWDGQYGHPARWYKNV